MRKSKITKTKKSTAKKPAEKQVAKTPVHVALTVLATKKQKQMTPALVKTETGQLGHVNVNEPEVTVNIGGRLRNKIVVHLIKEGPNNTYIPCILNGKPAKTLVAKDSFHVIKPAEIIRISRSRGATGISNRDYTKYNFEGSTYSKGRLVLALVRKFVEEHNPTMEVFSKTFAPEVIKPLGKFFMPADEAKIRNEASKRSRFFDGEMETLVVDGNKISISNQIDQGIVDRLLAVAKTFNYAPTPVVG